MKDRAHDDAMAEVFRKNRAYAVELLNSILEDGDQGELLIALRQMTKACGGVSKAAEKAHLNGTHTYRTLSVKGNPESQPVGDPQDDGFAPRGAAHPAPDSARLSAVGISGLKAGEDVKKKEERNEVQDNQRFLRDRRHRGGGGGDGCPIQSGRIGRGSTHPEEVHPPAPFGCVGQTGPTCPRVDAVARLSRGNRP